MAINQAQVDHIISTASADDPEIKMQRLQDEVDLIKKSIKKLLIDIRERMNELENPFVLTNNVTGSGSQIAEAQAQKATAEAQKATAEAQKASAEAEIARNGQRGSDQPVREVQIGGPAPMIGMPGIQHSPVPYAGAMPAAVAQEQLRLDEALLRSIHEKIGNEKPDELIQEKLRLQKVHRLFDWTRRMVKKYGHDRLEIMADAYRAMGYVSEDVCDQIKEISRLMPETIGDLHEIGSDEFVTELYSLNRIIDPADASLDSDMIEVLMEHRRNKNGPEKKAIADEEKSGAEWADMLNRI